MKKILLASAILLSLSGCGGGDEDKDSKKTPTGSVTKAKLDIDTRLTLIEPEVNQVELITLKFSKAATTDGSIRYTIANETTTDDDIFVGTQTISFKRGDKTVVLPVSINSDLVYDDGETFTLTIDSVSGLDIENALMTITLSDPRTLPQLSSQTTQSDFKETDGQVDVKLKLTETSPYDGWIDFKLEMLDETKTESGSNGIEATLDNVRVEFKAGAKEIIVPITIIDNDIWNGGTTPHTLTAIDSQNLIITGGAVNTHEIKLTDDDENYPTVSFETEKIDTLTEGSKYQVAVILSHGLEFGTNVPFHFSSGTASLDDYLINVDGYDYSSDTNPGTNMGISFESKETVKYIEVEAKNDNVNEGGETIIINLLADQLSSNVEAGEHLTKIIIIPGDIKMNDSGVTDFLKDVNDISASPFPLSPQDYPNQDGESGLDVDNFNNSDGHAGRSYSKLDYAGNVLSHDSADYECIKDNNTGVVWERKSQPYTGELPPDGLDDSQLRSFVKTEINDQDRYRFAHTVFNASNYKYFWFNDDDSINGGNEGTTGVRLEADIPVSAQCAFPRETNAEANAKYPVIDGIRYCSTEQYLKYLNSAALCGRTDWEIPTIDQLRNNFVYQKSGINAQAPNFYDNINITDEYVSSTPSPTNSGSVFCLDNQYGHVKLCSKNTANSVIAVAGGLK